MLTPEFWLELGDSNPYDAPDDWDEVSPVQPMDQATRAARGVINNLCDRRGIKHGFQEVEDEEIRLEIVQTLAAIIRAAHASPQPGVQLVD